MRKSQDQNTLLSFPFDFTRNVDAMQQKFQVFPRHTQRLSNALLCPCVHLVIKETHTILKAYLTILTHIRSVDSWSPGNAQQSHKYYLVQCRHVCIQCCTLVERKTYSKRTVIPRRSLMQTKEQVLFYWALTLKIEALCYTEEYLYRLGAAIIPQVIACQSRYHIFLNVIDHCINVSGRAICIAAVMANARARREKGFYATLNQLQTSDILPNRPKGRRLNKGPSTKQKG